MTTPLFNILARNLGKSDVDRGDVVALKGKSRRGGKKTSQQVIDAWLVANELFKSGVSKFQAAKEVGFRYQIGWSNLYCNWERIEAAARARK